MWYKQTPAPNSFDSYYWMDDNGWLNVGRNDTGIVGSKVCPFGPFSLSRRKYPHMSLCLHNWKDLSVWPAANIAYNPNKSQTVQSLGSLPFHFLQPEWKGHSLSVLKVTKTNKQLGYLLVAEEGVIVSALWVGNSFYLVSLVYSLVLDTW